jgi:hypothetical protein
MPAGEEGQAPGGPRVQAEDHRTIDEIVENFHKMPGLLTLYLEKKGASDVILMEVPESLFNKTLLLQITSASGLGDTPNAMVFHGMPLDDIPIKIRKVDDSRIEFVRPNLAHRSTIPEVQRMIARSFPDDVLASFDIHSRQASRKSYLIDVGAFFKSDVAEISDNLQSRGAAPGAGFAIDPTHSYIDSVKNFPENTVVHTILTLTRRAPAMGPDSPKTVPWAISYNISALPDHSDYKPRLGDPRIGYFTQNFQILDDQSARDQTVNYIERWNMQKLDPTLAISPPKKPIVFYVDNAVPKEYRDDVRRGLLMWNPAFLKLGIKNAIVVRQMPDDADWDIADLRYNVVRWTTGMPFAIALMRANPYTGEILNASINFDGVFAAGAHGEFDEVVNPSNLYAPEPVALPGNLADLACDMEESSARIGAEGENLFDSLQTAGLPFDRQAYIHQRLAEVVCHEMGHCLGLRHNFISSTQITLKQLSNPEYVREHGTSASVMDYVPYNVGAIKHKGVDYYQTTIGDYDRWAIQYGYLSVPGSDGLAEKRALSDLASQSGVPGHRYLSDATADSYDPSDVRYDFSAEPLDWSARLMQVSRYLLLSAENRRVQNGQSYYAFSRSWIGDLNSYLRAASYVPRYIGGVNLNNGFKGDADAALPIKPVDASIQRHALSLLTTYVFGESSFSFPDRELAMLTFNPNIAGNEATAQARSFPIKSTVGAFQAATLSQVLAPPVLSRISNNEFRSSNTLTLAELFDSLDASIWSELANGHEITGLRRELQIDYLKTLGAFLVKQNPEVPDDARSLALAHLKNLRTKLARVEEREKGPYGPAHIAECVALIDQALSAQVQISEEQPAPVPSGRRRG